ncbi:hypothetical protein COV93_03665 [Candidatus Woesearchaeota archaeon CG11_big_fil_rev_8_21_14_0_20_43_8]|nr:MAG: hypothetical protein COV93_03665 [Candidatus Woesearchaeota archaeon CG11_big_fil_rev_8_21_14_0_20_43_8]PIO08955.1 MAG: hypothetical protein COT47_00450 [Candidatus Woesearchaeota archaeon CG08_land_8_20_14_0_20_43_7]
MRTRELLFIAGIAFLASPVGATFTALSCAAGGAIGAGITYNMMKNPDTKKPSALEMKVEKAQPTSFVSTQKYHFIKDNLGYVCTQYTKKPNQ